MNAGSEGSALKNGLSLFLQAQTRATPSLSWFTGIKCVDTQLRKIFSGGNALSTHLVATHLLAASHGTQTASQPTTFIVSSPSAQTMFSLAGLLDQRLQAQPAQSRLDPTALLGQVQLLQYLSSAGLIESIGDVSTALYEATSSAANVGHSPTPMILLLQGLSNTLADTNRRSGSIQTAALATNILRSLTHLCRTYDHLLVLVELDLETRSASPPSDSSRAAALATSPAGNARRNNDADMLLSAFASQHGHTLSLLPSAPPISSALASGVDIIIAVHDAFGKTRAYDKEQAKRGAARGKTAVVEVLKDRVGGSIGEWCLWFQ